MTALKQAALSHFSIPMLFSAKKSLWEFCNADFSLLDVPFTPRRSSEKRTQAAADLEDILLAFPKLDEADKIPQFSSSQRPVSFGPSKEDFQFGGSVSFMACDAATIVLLGP